MFSHYLLNRLNHRQTLYTGSIKFNILLGAIKPAEEVTEDELKAVCRDANILDFIESLPECVFHLVSTRFKMLIFFLQRFRDSGGKQGKPVEWRPETAYRYCPSLDPYVHVHKPSRCQPLSSHLAKIL
jgi:hypothetical protein